MRLIDADALKEDLEARIQAARSWIEEAKDEETKVRAEQAVITFVEALLTLKGAPPIEKRKMGELEEQTVMGYPLKELVIFAAACRKQNISDDQLRDFVLNLRAAYDLVTLEIRESFDAVLDERWKK